MKKYKSKFSKYLTKYPNGGDPKKPIIVNDPNDSRLQAYKDSMNKYNSEELFLNALNEIAKPGGFTDENLKKLVIAENNNDAVFDSKTRKYTNEPIATYNSIETWQPNGNPVSAYYVNKFKKPTQPVEYQKPNSNKPTYLSETTIDHNKGIERWDGADFYTLKRYTDNISKLKTKDLGLVNSNTNKAKTLPVNKTKFNTDNNYTITSGIDKNRNVTYFPDEQLLNEAVTNLRTKYPKSVQSQKSKGKANYDFPGANSEDVMKFPGGGKIPIQTTDPNKVNAYNDSLQLHNLTKGVYDKMLGDMKNGILPESKVPYHIDQIKGLAEKTTPFVEDLYNMGINYKVKGYNKVPIGSNGEITDYGKLQKVAPMPKQPYFFKGGGKLSYGGSIGTGAASGAAMGATIGSIIPVWGTAAGAVIGGVAGGVGGYFKEKNQQESLERQEDLNTNLNPNFNMNPLGNSFKNGGYLPDQEYDLSEAEIEKLIRKGYKIKRLQ